MIKDLYEIKLDKPCEVSIKKAKKRWDTIAKPLDSLGKLEENIIKIAGIQRNENVDISKAVVIVMCADNGVVAQNVTQSKSDVTYIVANNITHNNATVCVMAKSINASVVACDIGMEKTSTNEQILDYKLMNGTNDMTKGSAMSYNTAIEAIRIGIDLVKEYKEKGYNIIITGEMGIGNTTTSSAIASVLLDLDVEDVTGKGAGLSADGIVRKINAIKTAIEVNKPDKNCAIDVLAKVGGLDIAGMVGLFLGGAIYHIPVVIDGFISAVAALIAQKINSDVNNYMIPSHVSYEPCGKIVLDKLGLSPMINCNMCLGEGTGGVLGVSILRTGIMVYNEMSDFANANIEQYVPLS